jgi:CDP-glucose 4,6-dehydratase
LEYWERTLGTTVEDPLARFSGARVFVTGHTGFKGSWLVALLSRLGARCFGYSIDVPTTPSLFEEARLANDLAGHEFGDIRDASRLQDAVSRARPDVVFHLAAEPLVLASLADPARAFEVNCHGTVQMLEAIRKRSGVLAALMITTDKVYRPRADRPLVEDDSLGGEDPYSASKAAAEIAIASYRESFFRQGTIVASARAGNVIGGGDWANYRLLPDLARAAQGDGCITLRYPSAVRPWQHVFDALEGYLRVAVRALSGDRSAGDAWNFGPSASDHATVQEVVQMFSSEYGFAPTITIEAAPALENPTLRLDSSRARSLLDWHPVLDGRGSVRATADFYRARANGSDVRSLLFSQIDELLQRVEHA